MIRTKTKYNKTGIIIARDYERCLSTLCHHVSNDKYYGTNFLLENFQRENIWKPIFACGKMVNGEWQRQYRRFIIGEPSGYGKTEFAAGLVLTISTMEPIYNGQYGLIASSVDQVKNVYEKIVTMIKIDPTLSQQWDTGQKIIRHRETNAKIMVFPNKPDALESWHLNVAVLDEMHTYKNNKLWQAVIKGQKVLDNSILIGITTAADSREGFLWELLEKAPTDKGMYVYWLGLDDDDDIDDPKSWEKLLVASWVDWDSIQDQRGTADSKRAFERYTANRFPSKKDDYSCFTSKQLNACCKKSNDFDFEQPWTLGIDGATSGDSFAIIGYQERTDSKGKKYSCTCEWVFDEPDEETGHYNLGEIMELIVDIYNKYHPDVVGIDPNRMIVMSNQLEDNYGIETTAFAQNNAIMCQASSLVIHLVKDNQLRLKGCPKLKAHLANCIEDDKGSYGVRFGKDSKKSKIDAAIALAIATLAYEKLVSGQREVIPF